MKKVLVAIVVVVGLLIIAALVAPYFIPAGTLKKVVIQRIETATGRQVTVNGLFKLRFFPVAGVTMENVQVTNPPAYGDSRPFMTLASLDVDVAVVPLLHGAVEIRKLVLEKPQIYLHVTKNGIKNWLPPQQAKPPAASTAGKASSSAPPLVPQNLSLNDVKMEDGSVLYDNEATGSRWNIQKVNASLALSGVSSPFTMDANGEWNGKPVTVKGRLATLESFLKQEPAKINADISSELLKANVNGVIENWVYSGKAQAQSPSLKALAAWLNPASPIHATAVMAFRLDSDVRCSEKECSLSNAGVTLDNIQAKGSIKANWAQLPRIDADLVTNVLNLNPFLASQQADAASGLIADAHADMSGHWSDKPMDFRVLQAFNGSANITADGIVVNKITLGKTTLHARLENGKLNADIPSAALYAGNGDISLTLDAAAASVSEQATLKGVELKPLLKDAADLSRLSGVADISINSSGHGKNEQDLIRSLSGSGQFSVANGALEGVDLPGIILKKVGGGSGGAATTPISAMKGSFTIAQGVISNKDLVMNVPGMNISGQGTVNLPAYTIDYRLTPQIEATKGGQTRTGVAVPVMVEGSLEKPDFRPDLNAVAQEALKNPQEFKKQLQNTRKNLENQFKGGLNNPNAVKNLKNLLNGL